MWVVVVDRPNKREVLDSTLYNDFQFYGKLVIIGLGYHGRERVFAKMGVSVFHISPILLCVLLNTEKLMILCGISHEMSHFQEKQLSERTSRVGVSEFPFLWVPFPRNGNAFAISYLPAFKLTSIIRSIISWFLKGITVRSRVPGTRHTFAFQEPGTHLGFRVSRKGTELRHPYSRGPRVNFRSN